jgi:hypothetical protein
MRGELSMASVLADIVADSVDDIRQILPKILIDANDPDSDQLRDGIADCVQGDSEGDLLSSLANGLSQPLSVYSDLRYREATRTIDEIVELLRETCHVLKPKQLASAWNADIKIPAGTVEPTTRTEDLRVFATQFCRRTDDVTKRRMMSLIDNLAQQIAKNQARTDG